MATPKTEETKENKFVSTLSASDSTIKSSRATNLAELASIESSSQVQDLRRQKLTIEAKIAKLTDLAPETTTSLRPGSEDFNPSKWIKELHQLQMDLRLKKIELEVAEEIHNEWFQ